MMNTPSQEYKAKIVAGVRHSSPRRQIEDNGGQSDFKQHWHKNYSKKQPLDQFVKEGIHNWSKQEVDATNGIVITELDDAQNPHIIMANDGTPFPSIESLISAYQRTDPAKKKYSPNDISAFNDGLKGMSERCLNSTNWSYNREEGIVYIREIDTRKNFERNSFISGIDNKSIPYDSLKKERNDLYDIMEKNPTMNTFHKYNLWTGKGGAIELVDDLKTKLEYTYTKDPPFNLKLNGKLIKTKTLNCTYKHNTEYKIFINEEGEFVISTFELDSIICRQHKANAGRGGGNRWSRHKKTCDIYNISIKNDKIMKDKKELKEELKKYQDTGGRIRLESQWCKKTHNQRNNIKELMDFHNERNIFISVSGIVLYPASSDIDSGNKDHKKHLISYCDFYYNEVCEGKPNEYRRFLKEFIMGSDKNQELRFDSPFIDIIKYGRHSHFNMELDNGDSIKEMSSKEKETEESSMPNTDKKKANPIPTTRKPSTREPTQQHHQQHQHPQQQQLEKEEELDQQLEELEEQELDQQLEELEEQVETKDRKKEEQPPTTPTLSNPPPSGKPPIDETNKQRILDLIKEYEWSDQDKEDIKRKLGW